MRTADAGASSTSPGTAAAWQAMGFDTHSVFADPLFVDPESNDYRVRSESPALKLGFQNFPMGTWRLTEEFPDVWRY